MDALKARLEQAREVYRRMFDQKKLDGLESSIKAGRFGSKVAALAQEFAFGMVWSRPGLDRKTRSVVTISALIALGKREELIKHLGVGLNHGLTVEELEEIIVQTIPYAGFPAASQALEAAHEMMQQRGIA